MKAYGGVHIYEFHIFLTSAKLEVSGQLHAPAVLPLGEGAPSTHWMGDWEGPRASLDDMENTNFSPYRDSNSDPSVFQPVGSRYTDYATPATNI
jgi:hypothetical protein